jgi:hypothetical protein
VSSVDANVFDKRPLSIGHFFFSLSVSPYFCKTS